MLSRKRFRSQGYLVSNGWQSAGSLQCSHSSLKQIYYFRFQKTSSRVVKCNNSSNLINSVCNSNYRINQSVCHLLTPHEIAGSWSIGWYVNDPFQDACEGCLFFCFHFLNQSTRNIGTKKPYVACVKNRFVFAFFFPGWWRWFMSVGNRKLSLFVKGCWNTQSSREGNPLSLEIIILDWIFWFVLNAKLKLGRSYFCIIVWIDIQVSLNLPQSADISRNKTCLQRRNRQCNLRARKVHKSSIKLLAGNSTILHNRRVLAFHKNFIFLLPRRVHWTANYYDGHWIKKSFYFLSIFIGMGNNRMGKRLRMECCVLNIWVI